MKKSFTKFVKNLEKCYADFQNIFGGFSEVFSKLSIGHIIDDLLIGLTGAMPKSRGRGRTCYVGVPRDVPFSWVYFLPKNSKVGYQF